MKKKVALHNLGCKVNAYEVEAMQQLLENAGYETVPFEEGADVYVINTCTVTNIADRKSRQMLHKAKKMKGNLFFHILPLIFSDSFILFLILIVFLYIQAKD